MAESLEARDIRVHIRGVKAVDGVDLTLRRGRDTRPDRPQRRGQDDTRERARRVPACDGPAASCWEVRTSRPGSRPRSRAPGSCARFRTCACSRRSRSSRTSRQRLSPPARRDGRLARSAGRLLERVGLEQRADGPASALPHGEQRRLAIARALAARPLFLLLDEPAAGLDEGESDELVGALAAIRDAFNMGLLVIEHDMRLIMKLAEQHPGARRRQDDRARHAR